MAFATTNVVRESSGSQNVFSGTWTAAIGDAAGTITIGNVALAADFFQNTTSGARQDRTPVSGLGSSTLTIYHQGTVTDGRFRIVFK